MKGTFSPSISQIGDLLASFGIQQMPAAVDELLRYDCAAEELSEKQFRLILKLSFADHTPLVMKFRGGGDERDRRFVIEAQTAFADLLYKNGIATSQYHRCGPWLTRTFDWNGYHTVVTLENFCESPIAVIDENVAYKTGQLLAQMHTVSEENRCHVPNRVIMDVFGENDFFDVSEFEILGKKMSGAQLQMHSEICRAYAEKAAVLTPLKGRRAYAVQGDTSIDNIYRTEDGGIGVFDFNCSGDNILFCDAVMEAWFLAHNMDYAEPLTEEFSDRLACAYLRGYHEMRPFTDAEKQMIPPLYAIATAFDGRITDRLVSAMESQDPDGMDDVLAWIHHHLTREYQTIQ